MIGPRTIHQQPSSDEISNEAMLKIRMNILRPSKPNPLTSSDALPNHAWLNFLRSIIRRCKTHLLPSSNDTSAFQYLCSAPVSSADNLIRVAAGAELNVMSQAPCDSTCDEACEHTWESAWRECWVMCVIRYWTEHQATKPESTHESQLWGKCEARYGRILSERQTTKPESKHGSQPWVKYEAKYEWIWTESRAKGLSSATTQQSLSRGEEVGLWSCASLKCALPECYLISSTEWRSRLPRRPRISSCCGGEGQLAFTCVTEADTAKVVPNTFQVFCREGSYPPETCATERKVHACSSRRPKYFFCFISKIKTVRLHLIDRNFFTCTYKPCNIENKSSLPLPISPSLCVYVRASVRACVCIRVCNMISVTSARLADKTLSCYQQCVFVRASTCVRVHASVQACECAYVMIRRQFEILFTLKSCDATDIHCVYACVCASVF